MTRIPRRERRAGGLYQAYADLEEFEGRLQEDLEAIISRDLTTGAIPMGITGMLSNQSWTITFMPPELATEILYRFQGHDDFKSTGTAPRRPDELGPDR